MRRTPLACAVLVLTACGAAEQPAREAGPPQDPKAAHIALPATGGRLLERDGVRVRLPDGWDGRLGRAALHAANFDLADFAPGEPLRGNRLLIQLYEMDPGHDSPAVERSSYPDLAAVPALAAEDFRTPEPGTFQSDGVARRTFALSRRLFILFVTSGSHPPGEEVVGQLNRLLKSVEVAPGDFYPGTVEPPRFRPRPGWYVGDSGPREVRADGDWLTAWAATIPYRDPWNAMGEETARALPDDGIAVWVLAERNNRFPPTARDDEGNFPPRRPPFRLSDFERQESWEGGVPGVVRYRLLATVRGQYRVDVVVHFGHADPTRAMLDEAQVTLDGLRLPDWGPWESE